MYANSGTKKKNRGEKVVKKLGSGPLQIDRGSIYRAIGQLNDWMAAFWRDFSTTQSCPRIFFITLKVRGRSTPGDHLIRAVAIYDSPESRRLLIGPRNGSSNNIITPKGA